MINETMYAISAEKTEVGLLEKRKERKKGACTRRKKIVRFASHTFVRSILQAALLSCRLEESRCASIIRVGLHRLDAKVLAEERNGGMF